MLAGIALVLAGIALTRRQKKSANEAPSLCAELMCLAHRSSPWLWNFSAYFCHQLLKLGFILLSAEPGSL
jgi:hypothetical protein